MTDDELRALLAKCEAATPWECARCLATGTYWPPCSKCDDPGNEHDDCPGPQPCGCLSVDARTALPELIREVLLSRDAEKGTKLVLGMAKVYKERAERERDVAIARAEKAERERDELRAALETVQWGCECMGDWCGFLCSACGNGKDDGHASGCVVGGALGSPRDERRSE